MTTTTTATTTADLDALPGGTIIRDTDGYPIGKRLGHWYVIDPPSEGRRIDNPEEMLPATVIYLPGRDDVPTPKPTRAELHAGVYAGSAASITSVLRHLADAIEARTARLDPNESDYNAAAQREVAAITVAFENLYPGDLLTDAETVHRARAADRAEQS